MSLGWVYEISDLPEDFDEYGDALKLVIRPIYNGYLSQLMDREGAVEATIRNLSGRGLSPESTSLQEHE